jgi:hypothetical protein
MSSVADLAETTAVGASFGAGFGAGASSLGSGLGLVSREPTWSLAWYFLRMPSLWYFQNCLEASLPATRWRIFLPPGFGALARRTPAPLENGGARQKLTRMVILEGRQVIHVAVDSDVEAVRLVVGRHLGGSEDLGHCVR